MNWEPWTGCYKVSDGCANVNPGCTVEPHTLAGQRLPIDISDGKPLF